MGVELVVVGAVADPDGFPELGQEQLGPDVIDTYTVSEVSGGEV